MANYVHRLGTEVTAHSNTMRYQFFQATASLSAGGFVVVWMDENGDGDGYSIRAQRFDSSGAKVGTEILVNSTFDLDQQTPAVVGLASGGFAVTWIHTHPHPDHGGDNLGASIRGRVFDADGVALAPDFLVNTSPWGNQREPALLALADGGFVATWTGILYSDSATEIVAQHFNAAGAKVGSEFRVNATFDGTQHTPSGAALTTGGYVIVWTQDKGTNSNGIDVYGQRFDASGNPVGSEFLLPATSVSGETPSTQYGPDVAALPGGGFVAVWQHYDTALGRYQAHGQIFSPSGARVGPEFTASNPANDTHQVSVTALSWGGFVVAWDNFDAPGFFTPTERAQLFDAAGNRLGDQFQINISAGEYNSGVDLATIAGDRIVATWRNGDPDVKVQVFTTGIYGTAAADELTGTALDELIFGFGDDDALVGNGGDDRLDGGDGSDILAGGAGADRYTGGDGIDTVDFSGEPGPVAVNLHSSFFLFPAGHPFASRSLGPGEALDSFGNYETLSGIENLVLTAGDDRVLGSDVANRLEGEAGNDEITAMGGNDTVRGGAGDDGIGGGEGDDVLEGGDDHDSLFGDAGNDMIDGGSGDDFGIGGVGNDMIWGAGGDDLLRGEDGNDTLSGGNGFDLLRGGNGVDSFDGGGNDEGLSPLGGLGDRISFFEVAATQGVVADLRNGTITNDGFGNAETMTGIESLGADTAFADTFYGNDNPNGLIAGRGDFVYGFGGDDRVEAGLAPAVVDGGTGTDLLLVRSDGGFLLPDTNSDGNAELSTAMTSGWNVDLFGGTVRDGFGNVGTVTGVENLVGSALGDELRGEGGANRLEGGGGNDFLLLQDGGDDIALGGEGNDVIYFGTALSAGDVADGGAGRDAVVLQGNVTALFTDTNLVGIESISIQSGANTRFGDTANNFYDFDVTTADGNVAAGQQLIVNASSLRAGEDFTFDGSAETDGRFLVYGGHGVDDLTGGDGVDVFFFEGQRWGPDDKVDGGAGRDSLVISGGSGVTHIEFAADALTNIESISLNNHFATDPSQKPSYELVLHNGNVAPGGTLIVNGFSLTDPAQTVSIDGSGVEDGNLILFGGAGRDILKGGDGADLLFGAGGGDQLTGGGGADVFQYRQTSHGGGRIHDFQAGLDKIDLRQIDADITQPGDQAFTVIGSAQFSGQAGQLRIVDLGNNWWLMMADTDGDGFSNFSLDVTRTDSSPMVASDFLL